VRKQPEDREGLGRNKRSVKGGGRAGGWVEQVHETERLSGGGTNELEVL